MAQTIRIKMMEKEVEVELSSNILTKSTIKAAFLLADDTIISLSYEVDGRRIGCQVNDAGTRFLLPDGWPTIQFFVEYKMPSRPAKPMNQAMNERPVNPYYPAFPPDPAPKAGAFIKWMFFLNDHMGKATAICVHPRFFITFRHGTHLQFKIGDELTIYHVKEEVNEQNGVKVCVVKVNEALDFVLLKSEVDVVDRGPSIARAEKSELFTLAGFDNEKGSISYLPGVIHSVRDYYFVGSQSSMGPFILGTGQSSGGNSGGGIWGSCGLIGMNVGCAGMRSTSHYSAISDAAIFSAKNIISPAFRFKEAYMEELEAERRKKKVESPPPKKYYHTADFEGLGTFYGSSV